MRPSVLIGLTLLIGCGETPEPSEVGLDSGSVERPDSGPPDDGGSMDAGDVYDGGLVDAGTETGTVVLVVPNGDEIEGTIDPAGDIDEFRVDVEAGEFLWIEATRAFRTELDPVLELIGPDGILVALNDDVRAGENRSSEIIYRVPVTGSYIFRIHEWYGWSPESADARGGPDYVYRLRVRTLTNGGDFTIEAESGDDQSSAIVTSTTTETWGLIAGTFDHPRDVDVFRFDVDRELVIRLELVPTGQTGYGSTARPLELVLTSTDGATLYGKVPLDRIDFLRTPVPAGSYLVWLRHPEDQNGANDFYVVKKRIEGFGFVPEPLALDNDELTSTGTITFDEMGPTQFLGTLPVGDVDHFNFELTATFDDPFYVLCLSRRWGSGIEGLEIEVLGNEKQRVGFAVESFESLAYVAIEPAWRGTHYLSVRRGPQVPDNPTDFYMCEFF